MTASAPVRGFHRLLSSSNRTPAAAFRANLQEHSREFSVDTPIQCGIMDQPWIGRQKNRGVLAVKACELDWVRHM